MLFTIFPDFISTFQIFFQVWKIAQKIWRLFLRIQDSVRTLSFEQGISIHKVARAHPRCESYFGSSHQGWIFISVTLQIWVVYYFDWLKQTFNQSEVLRRSW